MELRDCLSRVFTKIYNNIPLPGEANNVQKLENEKPRVQEGLQFLLDPHSCNTQSPRQDLPLFFQKQMPLSPLL